MKKTTEKTPANEQTQKSNQDENQRSPKLTPMVDEASKANRSRTQVPRPSGRSNAGNGEN